MAELISIQHIIFSEKTKRKSKKSQRYKTMYIFSFPSEGTTHPINHRASLKSTEATTAKEPFERLPNLTTANQTFSSSEFYIVNVQLIAVLSVVIV